MVHEYQKPLQLNFTNWTPKRQKNTFEIVSDVVEKEEEIGTLRKRCNRKRLRLNLAILLLALILVITLVFTVIYEKPEERERIQFEEVVQQVQQIEVKPVVEKPIEELPKKQFKYVKLALYDNIPVEKQFWKDIYYESISEEYFNAQED